MYILYLNNVDTTIPSRPFPSHHHFEGGMVTIPSHTGRWVDAQSLSPFPGACIVKRNNVYPLVMSI